MVNYSTSGLCWTVSSVSFELRLMDMRCHSNMSYLRHGGHGLINPSTSNQGILACSFLEKKMSFRRVNDSMANKSALFKY